MFRNSVWFLCVLLLCFGNTLSQNGSGVNLSNNATDHDKHTAEKQREEANSQQGAASGGSPPKTDPIGEEKPEPPSNVTTSTETPKPPTPKPTVPTTSSTHAPPPSSSTPHTSPTTHAPPPSSSTPHPSPTTHAPTPPSSSTPHPSPSSSTPIPVTPQPGPQKGSWNVTDSKNVTCLRIDGIFSVDYIYTAINKTDEKVHFDIPERANSKGHCNNITLTWKENLSENALTFIFEKEGNNAYTLKSFTGYVYIPKHNETKKFSTNNKDSHFETPIGQSYSCSAMKQITVDNHTKVTLEAFHFQAFKTSNTTGFDTSVDCAGNADHTTPDIVPIVVGIVLALLVIAVLVAYLISRRRSQTRGYLSM